MPSTMLSSRATLAPSAGICGSASGRLGSRNAHVLSHRASSSSLRARRSSPVAARAVMEISEANFEEEVLKVRGRENEPHNTHDAECVDAIPTSSQQSQICTRGGGCDATGPPPLRHHPFTTLVSLHRSIVGLHVRY